MLDFSQRWTLWFESANHLGAWSAALLLIVVALLIQPPMRSNGWRRTVFLILIGLLALWFALLVAWSASRAAWIAVAIGFFVLVLANRTLRAWSVVLAATSIIAIGILSVDRVRDRALTVAEMGQDGSSQSRPRTWGAACEMAAAHPWSGVGGGQFDYYYTNWYEPPERDDRLRTANNDLLHVMAERGAVVGVLLLTLYGLGMSLIRDGWTRRQLPLIGLGLATGSFFVCGAFNNVITFGTLLPWVAVVTGSGLALLAWLNPWRVLLHRTMLSLGVAIALTIIVLLYGSIRITRQPVILINDQGAPCIAPTKNSINGTFILLGESQTSPRKIYRDFLPLLARHGWRGLIVEHLADVTELDRSLPPREGHPHRPVVVMSLGEHSTDLLKHLASTPSDISGAILCDNGFPADLTATNIPCPVLFIHGRLGNQRNAMDAQLFVGLMRQRWPSSAALEVAWGSTWQRLVPRLEQQITDWLAQVKTPPLDATRTSPDPQKPIR